MQVDFHHATTYVVARAAGLDHGPAATVAYASEYVDDATNTGLVRFDNGALYQRTSSAHKTLDYRNFRTLANHFVWIPFHFFPGNGGLPAGRVPSGNFIERLVCLPNSPPVRDMMAAAILGRDSSTGLHRLGVALHTYVDTWAHQGFAGVSHPINRATEVSVEGEPDQRLSDWFSAWIVNDVHPLGHGTVLSCPDKPFLQWSYVDGNGRTVYRDNPRDFLAAAEAACVAIQRFIRKDPSAVVSGLPVRDRDAIAALLVELTDDSGEVRHARWLEQIRSGAFSFGPQELGYIPKGEGSWKHLALGTTAEVDDDDVRFPFTDAFLKSDWKRFHDAVSAQRLAVTQDVLPRYGICTA